MILMTSLIAPAVSNFGRAGSLTNGGNLLYDTLGLARQNAMTRGALTAMVMITEGEDSHRAFSIFELAPKADGSQLTSADWKQLTRWQKLPEGIVSESNPFEGFSTVVSPALPAIKYQGEDISSSGFKYVVFQPNGGLYNATLPARIQLVEGYWSGASLKYTRNKGNEPANFYELFVLPASGRLKLNRL